MNVNWTDKTILIVEDDWVNYLYLKEVVESLSAKTLHAKNGLEAIEACKENKAIDLVLMDIKLPEMSGYEATKLIRKIRPNMVIIAQSAYALQNEVNRYKDAFNSYLTKPVEAEKLIEVLEKYLAD